jgi:hypothetical protein
MTKPEMSHKVVKLLITGEIEMNIDPYKGKKKNFLMVYNLEKCKIEKIKVLNMEAKISCINYGPYDNGHIMLGMNEGTLLTFEF